MRPIYTDNGSVYAYVEVTEQLLKITFNHGNFQSRTMQMDAKVIPQLRQILTEAEFFKVV